MLHDYTATALDTKNIRQLSLDDFEAMYQIWQEGIATAFSNSALHAQDKQTFYQAFFQNKLRHQDHNFKVWGYFHEDNLVGWQSLLPCQSAPMVWHKYAESSTYIKAGDHNHGVGRALMSHAIEDARSNSELAYILGFVVEGNLPSEKLILELGFQKIGSLPKSTKDDVAGVTTNIWIAPL